MKTLTKLLAVAVAAGSIITVAGCAKKAPDARVATVANWNVRISDSVEKDSCDFWLNNKEIATYSIGFTPAESGNTTYSVAYDTQAENAVYETKFYMESYDWNADSLPGNEGYKAEATENVYVYETRMNLSGTYKLTADENYKRDFTDEVVSVCKFRMAGDNLQPVYSYQMIKDTAPDRLSAPNPDGKTVDEVMDVVCDRIDAVHETFYNRDCTEALIKTTDNINSEESGETTLSLASKEGYSVFDNSQIRAAVRAFNMTGGSSRIFNVVVPQSKAVQTCTATVGAPISLNPADQSTGAEQAQIISALNNCKDYIYFDGTSADNTAARLQRFNAVALSINASLRGQDPVQWYATVENEAINTTRAVLLRWTTPLSFNLGTLSYTLKELKLN